MDDTDRKLLDLLNSEPRMHYREFAKRLGISTQAVHHRMQALTKSGVILGIYANVSIRYLGAVPVNIFGRSRTMSIDETLDKLGESELSSAAVVAGGNFLYVLGLLREISELDGYAEFVKRVGEMPEPTVGIYCLDAGLANDYLDGGKRKHSYRELTPLDLEIITSLKDDARKSIVDIAKEIGVSTKTVRRRLSDMISDGSLDFDVHWDPTSGGDIIIFLHVNLRDGADKGDVGRRLISKYCPLQLAYMRSFSNLPAFLLCILVSDKMTEIRKVLREIEEDKDVLAIMPNLRYRQRVYTPWRRRLPAVWAGPSRKTGAHKLQSGLKRL